MFQFQVFIGGPFSTNTYLVYDDETKDSLIIDPASANPKLIEAINDLGVKPAHVLLTHGHSDHTDGLPFLRENLGEFTLVASELEAECLMSRKMSFGKGGIVADLSVKDGEKLTVGALECKFISTPGHTPGGMCIYFEKEKVLFAGDTLFFSSVGRTDLAGGNTQQLVDSIRNQLMCLPDDVRVFPGHSKGTTIGYERENNPYF